VPKKEGAGRETVEAQVISQPQIVMPDLRGTHIFDAQRALTQLGLKVGNILYDEFRCPVFQVFDQSIAPFEPIEENAVIDLRVSSENPIKYLPSIYQGSETLKNFLWIFQHILNSIQYKLDGIHTFFNPIEAPVEFYKWLGSWFSINVNYAITEEKMRCLIRDAVSLFQWRGTVLGLSKYLEIITDTKPDIIENFIPLSEYIIEDDALVEIPILDRSTASHYFTVKFPFSADHFSIDTIKKIYYIIQSEKPAHTQFSLMFSKEKKEQIVSFMEIGTNLIDDITKI
jgi:phage tail-like protein